MSRLVFVDSSVLMGAVKVGRPVRSTAQAFVNNEALRFVTTDLVWLEVMPIPLWTVKHSTNKKHVAEAEVELEVYKRFFARVKTEGVWFKLRPGIIEAAKQEAVRYGLGCTDAIHVACALAADADELVTVDADLAQVKSLRVRLLTAKNPSRGRRARRVRDVVA